MEIMQTEEVFNKRLEGKVVHISGTFLNGEVVDEVFKVERVEAYKIYLLGFGKTFSHSISIQQFQQINQELLQMRIMKPDKGVKE